MKAEKRNKELRGRIQKAATAIGGADALLVVAGSGMSVDSGIPYFRSNKKFWRAYPAIEKRGLTLEAISHPKGFKQTPRLTWGFYGHRLNLYQRTSPHTGFAQLLEMGKKKAKGCFVLTSSTDGLFQSAGFDRKYLEECYGSMHHLQCTQPCEEDVWRVKDLSIGVDSELFQAIGTLPACRQCGLLARPNILMFHDGTWISKRTKTQEERLWLWLENLMVTKDRLVILEVGVGNSASSLRKRSEFYTKLHRAILIRINPNNSQVPKSRHVSLPMAARPALEAIGKAWREQENS